MIVISIASITQYDVLIPVRQAVTHYAVGYFSRGDLQGVYQSGIHINTDMSFHTKMVLIAFLAMGHLWIAFTITVLGRRRCCNQGSINHCSLTQDQTSFCEHGADVVK